MSLIRTMALAAIICFAAFTPLSTRPAQSAPVNPSVLASQAAGPGLVEKTRLYCYNRYTGRFLHWGPCGGYRHYYYRPHYYYHPHYYYR
ncbi:MAG TPA: hypothetical protein VMU18_03710, partial [Rhodoblastus sp.]|nr:hypothetical protein [Rhodoblastus sp.]